MVHSSPKNGEPSVFSLGFALIETEQWVSKENLRKKGTWNLPSTTGYTNM